MTDPGVGVTSRCARQARDGPRATEAPQKLQRPTAVLEPAAELSQRGQQLHGVFGEAPSMRVGQRAQSRQQRPLVLREIGAQQRLLEPLKHRFRRAGNECSNQPVAHGQPIVHQRLRGSAQDPSIIPADEPGGQHLHAVAHPPGVADVREFVVESHREVEKRSRVVLRQLSRQSCRIQLMPLLERPHLAFRSEAEAHLPDGAAAVRHDAVGQFWEHAWHHNHVKRPQPVRPKKSLGQHFLADRQVVRDILAALDLRPADQVLEIGPGQGVLTRALVEAGARVAAVELDSDLIPELQLLPVQVIQADVLKVDPGRVFPTGPYKVAGNIPYYISSPILRHLLEAQPKPDLVVLMLQKELAQRVVASPGAMSLLSVSVQLYGRPEIVREVPATAFWPRPKVDSALLRIDVYREPAVRLADPERFFNVARAGFSERRKQVHNALQRNYKPAGAHTRASLDPAAVSSALRGIGVDPMRRAETLTLAEWANVADAISRLQD